MYIKQVLQRDYDVEIKPRLRGSGFTEEQLQAVSVLIGSHMDNDHPASPRGGVSTEEIENIANDMTKLTSARFKSEQIEQVRKLMNEYIH